MFNRLHVAIKCESRILTLVQVGFMNNHMGIDGFSERLVAIIGDSSPHAFAKKCGIGDSSFRPYLKGAFPRMDKLVAMAKAGGVNVEWLATGEGAKYHNDKKAPMNGSHTEIRQERILVDQSNSTSTTTVSSYKVPQVKDPDPGLFSYVPLINVHLSAGAGAFVPNENVIGYYAFRKSWLSRTTTGLKNLVLTMVTGNSMIPTLMQKDFVMVDTGQTRIADDLIYAIRVDDTVMVKRLRLHPGGKITVISDNRDEYESYETTHDDLNVIGQVIWSCRSYLTGL